MTATLARIWRHPIKAHGAERVTRTRVEAGRTLPFDRTWAVAHDAAKTDGSDWAHCANYSRGAKVGTLMAITATTDEANARVTLRHPARPDIDVAPDDPSDQARLLYWLAPLMPVDRAQSVAVHRVPGRGMTDTDFPSISLASLASLDAVCGAAGQPMDDRRFRANLWIDGLAPFAEFDLVGSTIRIGNVPFRVVERIVRCRATTIDPETGASDIDTLEILRRLTGEPEFGVYLVADGDGELRTGDELVAP